MEFENLTGKVRTERKKGTARRLRREGKIPAICYGPELAPVAISVDPKELSQALSGPLGRNIVIQMSVEGDGAPSAPLLVMLQDYQYHPVDRAILHADFLQVDLEREVHIQVPFKLTGRSVGVQAGGILAQVFRSLPVRCKPDAVPEKLELDVSAMDLGSIRKVSDLELPQDVTVELEPNQTLVSVSAPAATTTVEEGEEAPEGEVGPDAEAASSSEA